MPIGFTEERKKEFEIEFQKMLSHYPNKQAALLPALRLAEKHFEYNDDATCQYVADLLKLPPAKVLGVLTFYTHYKRPQHGRHRIMMCMTLPCHLRGSADIVEHLKRKLNIDVGQCTPDGKFSLEHVECLAACDKAPLMQINDTYHYHLTPEKVDEILAKLD